MKPTLVILLILGSLVSCSTSPSQTTQATSAQPTQSTSSGSQSQSTPVVIEPPTESTISGAYFLPDASVGLAGLTSYALDLTISFVGTRDGADFNYTDSYHQEVNREQNAAFTFASLTGPDGSLAEFVGGNIAQAYYSKSADGECKVSWGARAQGYQQLNPAQLLLPLLAANQNDPEVINGIQTDHYLLDGQSLGISSTTQVEGQVWLAQQGGYIVKYSLMIQDEDAFFGEGVKGQQQIDYELSQVNTLEGPTLPEGCQAVLSSIPTSEDAFDIQRLPDLLAYTSPTAMAQIESFYQQRLAELGWVLSSSIELSSDAHTLVFLNAAEAQTAYLSLQVQEGNTWVTVTVEATENLSSHTLP